MFRTTARAAGLAVATTVLLGLTACGSDRDIPSADNPSRGVTATPEPTRAPNAGSTLDPSAAPSGPMDAPDAAEVVTEAKDIAQVYVERALGDVAVVNAPTINDSVNIISGLLTDRLAAELVADPDPENAFRVVPYKIDGLANGQPATAAEVTVASMAIRSTTEEGTLIEVVADYKWTFGDLG